MNDDDRLDEDDKLNALGQVPAVNVLGGRLQPCSTAPVTGFWRDGCCNAGPADRGLHSVCAVMSAGFLEFSKAKGNDLSTPRPEFGFAGLKPGDRWCLCAGRWAEALEAGMAPPVVLDATHRATLALLELRDLRAHAVASRA